MQQVKRRYTIQFRVTLLTVVFTLIIAAAVFSSSMQTTARQIHQNNLQAARYQLKSASVTVRQRINEVDSLYNWSNVTDLVQTYLLSNAKNLNIRNEIYNRASSRCASASIAPYLQRFLLAGSNGSLLMLGTASSSSKPITLENIEQLPGLSRQSDGTAWEMIAGDPLLQPGIITAGIPIAHRIERSNTGYIYISVSPAIITDVLRDFRVEEGSCLYWVMGGTVFRLDKAHLEPVSFDFSALRQVEPAAKHSEDTLLYETSIDGALCSVVVCPLGIHNLYLAKTLPVHSVWRQLPELAQPILLTLLIILVLGVVLTWLLHRILARPINALQRQIDSIGKGNFSTDPQIEWNHELGDIGRGINRLAENVTALMERRLDDEKQKQELEFKMLQSQINPHFLYNTLNSIRWMASIQHADGIVEMVTALSRLLKSISKSTQQMIPLRQELSLLNDYFIIQRYRYGGTITLDIRNEVSEEALDSYFIPRFTLQPLAENAIFHGIEPKGCAGSLILTIQKADTDLLLELTDDGVGMTEEQLASIWSSQEDNGFRHIGVQNVHKRLCFSFGARYGLRFRSTPKEGTTVSFLLAPRKKEDKT